MACPKPQSKTVTNTAGKPRPVEEKRVIGGVVHVGYREWPSASRLTFRPVGPARPAGRDVYR